MMSPDPLARQLSLARQGLTPPSELRQRVRARFGASEQIPAAGLTRVGGARRGWSALRMSGNVGLAVAVGLFGLGCFTGWLGSVFIAQPELQRHEPSSGQPRPVGAFAAPSGLALPPVPMGDPEPAALAAASASVAGAPPAPAAPAAHSRDGAPEADASRSRLARRRAQRATPPRDWRSELALLERAERAVRTDNVALALALLGDFDVRYPRSLLVEERAAVETMAHCQADATDSSARAARFRNVYPKSLYRTRVEAVCQPEAPEPPSPSSDKTINPGH